ncbi:MAG TPA: hypothetical protein VFB63_29465 [Bryobacteraceae bacterium]|jgi:hypothetical protein|nr:hypothetical protein [Bryobacteraceae bacterium]
MKVDTPAAAINIAKIPVGAGAAGAIFAAGSMAILLFGVPLLQFLLPAALVVGGGIALALHWMPHQTPGTSWILSATKK